MLRIVHIPIAIPTAHLLSAPSSFPRNGVALTIRAGTEPCSSARKMHTDTAQGVTGGLILANCIVGRTAN